jgi:hypothetical protein
LVSFDGIDGAGPVAGLIADANGDLFSTTAEGGAAGNIRGVTEVRHLAQRQDNVHAANVVSPWGDDDARVGLCVSNGSDGWQWKPHRLPPWQNDKWHPRLA